jgi:4-hydroxy-2-oxoheptanedioate aldolase
MKLAERLSEGEVLFTAWSAIPDSLTVDAVAATGFDAVTLDMQHGGHDEASVLRGVPSIVRHGKPAIVRIPVGRFDMASRALDFGAEAVIAPMINSIADAKSFSAAMKYPPVGERSWGPTRSVSLHHQDAGSGYLREANAKTLALAMIETRQAWEQAEAIMSIEGIDGLFVGPADFSIAWSGGIKVDPGLHDMMEAIAQIAAIANTAGKLAGIFAVDPKICGQFRQMGYGLIAIGNETRYMIEGTNTLLERARA